MKCVYTTSLLNTTSKEIVVGPFIAHFKSLRFATD